MEKEQYKILFELEDNYWWHASLRKLIVDNLRRNAIAERPLQILDAGCGTGGNLATLRKEGRVVGLDLSEDAIYFSRKRGVKNLLRGSVSALPFKDGSFNVLLSIDVLYHRFVRDDTSSLKEFHRMLTKGGILILHLPAFEFLRGPHDKLVYTQRRYTKDEISKKLLLSGFKIKKISYKNSLFFFTAYFLRKTNAIGQRSELKKLPRWVNWTFYHLTNIENLLLRSINLPCGLSIFCIAEKV